MTTQSRRSLPRFITTEAISSEYEDSYQKIWDAVRPAFTSRHNSVGYWRYPLFLAVGDRRKEPDILVIDQEWGIITIEERSNFTQSIICSLNSLSWLG